MERKRTLFAQNPKESKPSIIVHDYVLYVFHVADED